MEASPNDGLGEVNVLVVQHNVQSLRSNKAQVVHYLEERNVHVYMVSETWLLPDDEFFMKNYALHENRKCDGYGGVAIFFKNNVTFNVVELPEFKVINVVAAITTNLPMNLTFVSVYVPAKKKTPQEAEVRKDLMDLLKVVKGFGTCVIGGDFNAFNNVWGEQL